MLSLITVIARLALGALLVLTGALKAGHAPALASAIAGFRLLPIVGLFTRIVAGIAAVQFVVYALAIASTVARGIPAYCGCFGPNDAASPSTGDSVPKS